jgi:hypothetical protein
MQAQLNIHILAIADPKDTARANHTKETNVVTGPDLKEPLEGSVISVLVHAESRNTINSAGKIPRTKNRLLIATAVSY